ncbi:MAG: hypothetical protein ONB51_13915 [candidate division KSB1 bacterium]|nr:hypothetical protein [candidate division KSB1 bacterium]MDZ7410318.1 hypothetical protein [candidate division KSB1 bacterium]
MVSTALWFKFNGLRFTCAAPLRCAASGASACWAAFFQELIIFKEKEPVSIHIKRDKLFPAPRLFF